ncbi:MAG: outer membrane lipid asymmetry maintenance protein MlaD [Xanthomonadaceae bacterium]|nr:outer membrane lipid asymmetry maintenance protein MlaD [Xanthomonadaceae bacterium]
MAIRGPRLEFSVGMFLLLTLASLLVLAFASTNRNFSLSGGHSYDLKARFTNIGQLKPQAPVRIGGVIIGRVSRIRLDPVKYDSIVTLAIDNQFRDLPADTSAGIYTSGLLGESYIGLQPGGDPDVLCPGDPATAKPSNPDLGAQCAGDEIAFTQPSIDLIQMVGKYMFNSGGGNPPPDGMGHAPDHATTPSMEPQL